VRGESVGVGADPVAVDGVRPRRAVAERVVSPQPDAAGQRLDRVHRPTSQRNNDEVRHRTASKPHVELRQRLCRTAHTRRTGLVISARCNIYISRLCYDVSVRVSVTFVHCGHRVQRIPDTFACLDRWMSLLLTDDASSGSSDGMMAGFLVEEGRDHLALC